MEIISNMAETESIRVQLDYPLERVTQPIIYHLVTDYHLIPNIRRANIDSHAGGMMVLQIEGTRADLEAGMDYLRRLGITVTEVGLEQPWAV
ncbi:MAG TPA: NIL domain-containing protein [Chthonomonadaceae bacterium]|nr:NIL domain-containing protein [Chthonomonadaceae bacterium]